MKRRSFTILAAVSLLLCVAVVLWVRHSASQSIGNRLESRIASAAGSFDFASETTFAWDRMLVFGPYSSRAVVEKSLGFAWPDFRRTTIESSDGVCLVVFVQGNRVVHWYEQSRAIELAGIANTKGYARSEAKFAVERSGNRATLRDTGTAAGSTRRAQ